MRGILAGPARAYPVASIVFLAVGVTSFAFRIDPQEELLRLTTGRLDLQRHYCFVGSLHDYSK